MTNVTVLGLVHEVAFCLIDDGSVVLIKENAQIF